MTQQLNLFYQSPELTKIHSTIIAVRPHFFGAAIAVDKNIVRAAGGGEPRDVGDVMGKVIKHVEKQDGKTWIAFQGDPENHGVGDLVEIKLDHEHRQNRQRLHTGVHVAIRCAYNHFGDVNVTEAEVSEDASFADVKGRVDRPIEQADIAQIDMIMRSEVLKARPVTTRKSKSVEHAEQEYGTLFRVSDRHAFKGKIRVVCIENLDVNPCSGLHHSDTNIGPYEMKANLAEAKQGIFSIRLNLSACWMYWYGD